MINIRCIDMADKTELSSTNRPPNERLLAFQPSSFLSILSMSGFQFFLDNLPLVIGTLK